MAKVIEVKMEFSKLTKRTVVYKAKYDGQEHAVESVYIEQWAFEKPPKEIKLTVEEVS